MRAKGLLPAAGTIPARSNHERDIFDIYPAVRDLFLQRDNRVIDRDYLYRRITEKDQ